VYEKGGTTNCISHLFHMQNILLPSDLYARPINCTTTKDGHDRSPYWFPYLHTGNSVNDLSDTN